MLTDEQIEDLARQIAEATQRMFKKTYEPAYYHIGDESPTTLRNWIPGLDNWTCLNSKPVHQKVNSLGGVLTITKGQKINTSIFEQATIVI